MSRKVFFLFLVFNFSNMTGFAQEKVKSGNLDLIGLQARVIDLMPFEISYIHLANNKLSYAIKAGIGIGNKNAVDYSDGLYYDYYSTGYYNHFTFNQSFVGYFIKPGIVIAKNKNPIIRSVHLLNYCISQSKDKLELVSDDQLFGKLTQTYEETNTYQAVELEGNFAFHRGSSFEVSFGYILGYKLHNPIPFTSVIKGIEQGSTYSPGQGVGRKAYVNFFIGLAYKL